MIPRRERSDAAEHRRLILQTARTLFVEQGVQSVSMHQIAKTAGVGQGTLYRCYAHKGELCAELMETVSKTAMKDLEDYLQRNRHLSPQERIAGMLGHMIDFIDEKYQWLLPLRSVQSCGEDATFFRSPMYVYLHQHFSALYQEANLKSNAGLSVDEVAAQVHVKAHALLCSLDPTGYLHLKESCGFTKEQILTHYRSLFAR